MSDENGLATPTGWFKARASEVCEKIQDGTHFSPKVQLTAGPYPYVTAKNVRPSGLDLRDITYLSEQDHREIYARCDCRKGDVLLVKDGVNTGDAAINSFDGEISLLSSVCMLRPRSEVLDAGFLRYYLQSPQCAPFLLGGMTGTAIRRIILKRIKALPVLACAIPEQREIVATIESYFTRLDDAVASLERVQRNLKRYRASVLKAAVEGRLVPTEAELARAEGRSYEPASVLLTRILAERRRGWEEAELAKMTAKGKAPKDDKWKAKYVEPVAPDTSELPELPEGWCWVTIEQVSSLVTDGDHNPPKRTSEGVPHLTAKNVKRWTLTLEGCSFLSAAGYEKTRSRYEPIEGDLIVTCVGTVGECALVPPRFVFSADRNLAAVRLVPLGAMTKYVLYFLSSPQTQTTLRGTSGSTAQPHLYLTDLRALALPLPPRDEQLRIVHEIETLLSEERSASDVVNGSRIRAERLRQSILKWAFEGRLVDQDPTDEPASVLLERIRAERATATDTPSRRARRANARVRK